MLTTTAQHPIAFFCAEFGVDSRLPLYAGGLGVLAGDILREAADQRIHMVGVGILYRGEGAVQVITVDGKQEEADQKFDPLAMGLEHVYVDELPLFVKVHLTEVDIWLRCWKKVINEYVTLYLLDTDTEQNHVHERGIAHALYGGTEEELIKQQLVLGIGGVKLLHALGIHPELYHVNEGRPSFLHWQLIRSYMDENGMTFAAAVEQAKNKTVYTNHTLVDAGNQSYTTGLLKAYSEYYARKMGITVDILLAPGLMDDNKQFSITRYALNTSVRASAVSQLHYQFCQRQWPKYNWVGITNGVYMPFWQDQRLKDSSLSPAQIWSIHREGKQQLAKCVLERTGFSYNPDDIVVTWSRRMTGYKQADAIFADIDRLREILAHPTHPVQILFAGKAHMYDEMAKQQITKIIHYMQHELAGHALFVPNLDIELDQFLTRGSDVWLNTPEFGKEASGTSGMKALSNGVLQCTVKDGWAYEVDWKDVGWEVDPNQIARNFYDLMETEIVPLYYYRDEQNIPQDWVKRMKKSIELSPQFSATRMIKEYQEKLYIVG